jgi:hypothetical protein
MTFDPNEKRDSHGQWTKTLASLMKAEGGFTHLVGSGETNPAKGIAVGVPSPDGKDWKKLPYGSTTPEDIAAFAKEHAAELAKPGRAIGGWSNPDPAEGEVRDALDVVEVHPNSASAYKAAKAASQDGAFDFQHGYVSTPDLAVRADKERAANDLRSLSDEVSRSGASADSVSSLDSLLRGDPHPDDVQRWLDTYGESLPSETYNGVQETINRLRASKKEKPMSLSIQTPVLRNGDYDLSSKDGKLAFWKQILPQKSIHYTAKDGSRQVIDFTREYLEGLAKAQAVDKVGFLLADKDNAHTMDPERWRAEVAAMEVREDGLYGKIVFPSTEAAKAVLDNPDLGVSARIRPNVQRSDGSTVPAGIIHVLGTLDPQVSGMNPWQPTDLSTGQDEVLDLTSEEYEDMAEKTTPVVKKSVNDFTEADIDAMTEAELDEFLAEFVPDFDNYTGDVDEPEGVTTTQTKDERELVGAGADMSTKATADIELANQRADAATARANEALRRVAEAEWTATRNEYLAEGVPPFALDLAAPVLNRSDDMVIDLSNVGEDDVNISEAVRGLLDALKGTVDLSAEAGHLGIHAGDDNPDQDILDRWTVEG